MLAFSLLTASRFDAKGGRRQGTKKEREAGVRPSLLSRACAVLSFNCTLPNTLVQAAKRLVWSSDYMHPVTGTAWSRMEEWEEGVVARSMCATHASTAAPAHLTGPEVARPQARAVLLLLLPVVGGQGHHRVASLRHPVVEQTRDYLCVFRFDIVLLCSTVVRVSVKNSRTGRFATKSRLLPSSLHRFASAPPQH